MLKLCRNVLKKGWNLSGGKVETGEEMLFECPAGLKIFYDECVLLRTVVTIFPQNVLQTHIKGHDLIMFDSLVSVEDQFHRFEITSCITCIAKV